MSIKYVQNFGGPDLNFPGHDFEPEQEPEENEEQEEPTETTDKPVIKWKINRWGILGIVLVTAIFMIISVAQVINTNNLLKEIDDLESNYSKRHEKNEILTKQINYLESPERITTIAKLKFNLIVPDAVPQFVNQ